MVCNMVEQNQNKNKDVEEQREPLRKSRVVKITPEYPIWRRRLLPILGIILFVILRKKFGSDF